MPTLLAALGPEYEFCAKWQDPIVVIDCSRVFSRKVLVLLIVSGL